NSLNKQKRNSNLISFDEVLHSSEQHTHATVSDMNPANIVASQASSTQLMEQMERLPLEFREALFLREIEGYSYKEIAEITQVPKGTVMSRLSRARGQLQNLLVEQQKRKQNRGV
ncbi:MAG: sigma-70 family RNA polymerase sigma factor, partial [Gammaproteobacteria bacterium]|nr:sigma-70 family RNA polymerase sigma factor [Gammaproteobacteria bacterium]